MATFYPDLDKNLGGRNDLRDVDRRCGESRRRGALNPWKMEIDLGGRQAIVARGVIPRRYRSDRRGEDWMEP